MQERVSRAIVKALHVTLSPDEDRRVAERPIQDVHAYERYLRARHEISSRTVPHRLTDPAQTGWRRARAGRDDVAASRGTIQPHEDGSRARHSARPV